MAKPRFDVARLPDILPDHRKNRAMAGRWVVAVGQDGGRWISIDYPGHQDGGFAHAPTLWKLVLAGVRTYATRAQAARVARRLHGPLAL